MTEDSKGAADYYWEQLCRFQDALENANENGLFRDNPTGYQKLVEGVSEAFSNIENEPPQVNDARRKFSLLWGEFNRCIDSASLMWRLNYCYCLPIVVYYGGVLLALLALWLAAQSSIISFSLFWVPSWAFIWGMIGSTLYGFWWLWQHVSHKKFRKVWYIWYLILPVLGSIFGALAYLVYNAGFIAATGNLTEVSTNGANSFAILLSALAGFSIRWTVNLLEGLTNLIKIGRKGG